MTKRNLITIENLFNQFFNEHPFKDLTNYINGLNYSSFSGFPPSNITLRYKGDEENKEMLDNIENYEWHLEMALSGFSKDEISLDINEDLRQIIVKAEKADKESTKPGNNDHILLQKLGYRNIKVSYSIPFHKFKDYEATLENGVLKVVVRPERVDNIKRIEIK